jgi:hypothetical protein
MGVAHFSRALSTVFADGVKAACNAGATGATINFYTVSMPANTTVGITDQTLLGTCTCATDCGTESGGTLTFSAITQDSSADHDGTAAWVRIKDSDGVVVCDLDVSVVGGSGYVQMVTTTVTAGAPIAFTSFTIALP